MANKISIFKRHQNLPKVPTVKWVKKASMWCKTSYTETGKQVQEWSIDKPVV